MSKLKHTPGPWAWQEGDRYIRIHDEESGKGGYWNESQKIAETYYVNNDEETISNNLLISAAPGMLEALIDAYCNMDSGNFKEIEAVVKKATGMNIAKVLEMLNEN